MNSRILNERLIHNVPVVVGKTVTRSYNRYKIFYERGKFPCKDKKLIKWEVITRRNYQTNCLNVHILYAIDVSLYHSHRPNY